MPTEELRLDLEVPLERVDPTLHRWLAHLAPWHEQLEKWNAAYGPKNEAFEKANWKVKVVMLASPG